MTIQVSFKIRKYFLLYLNFIAPVCFSSVADIQFTIFFHITTQNFIDSIKKLFHDKKLTMKGILHTKLFTF